jgi:acyl-CoA synthetase (AMP-forming)/AMP-acid ligase II
MNIAKSFLSRALSHPELRALTCGKQILTYGQLAQRVHGLAGGLLNTLHLAPGSRVILCMENRNAFIEVLFATWTAGLCAVPVNAKLHPREVKPIALDSGAAVIFTSASLYSGLAEALADLPGQRQLIVVDDDAYEGYVRSKPVPCASPLPDARGTSAAAPARRKTCGC